MAKSEAQTTPADVAVSGGNADTSQAQAPKDVPPENMPAADYNPSADEANKDDG